MISKSCPKCHMTSESLALAGHCPYCLYRNDRIGTGGLIVLMGIIMLSILGSAVFFGMIL